MTDLTSDKCPVHDFEFAEGARPAFEKFRWFDEVRERTPVFRSTEAPGYYVFTEHDTVVEALQNSGLFSSHATIPTMPNPDFRWIPQMLDAPEHTQWRRLLAGWFTPRRTESMDEAVRLRARELVEGIAPRGRCDFVTDFARLFPTSIFLTILGLPQEELPQLMRWEDAIMHGTSESDPDHSIMMTAMGEVQAYFAALIAKRRAAPDPDATDIVSAAAGWTIDGDPVPDQDVLSCLLLLFMAGLDTVANQLTYSFLHLATTPAHRERIVGEPEVIPAAIEEFLRAFPIVFLGRRVTEDVEFHGCPLRAGEVVALPLQSASRDGKVYPRGSEVDIDRGMVRNIAFGAGPHRCLGSHLARREMLIAMQEWHRLIPDYRLPPGVVAQERSGNGVYGIDELRLEWDR